MQHQDTNVYLLVAYPDKSVLEKILAERNAFCDSYSFKPKPSLKPHVLLTSFYASEGMESTLIRWLQRICGNEQGFTITLNNYSGFPDHTILLRVPDAEHLQNFAGQLNAMKDFIQPGVAGFFRRPHIAIATDLPHAIYEQALSDYSRKLFHETFQVKELVLLKSSDAVNQFCTVQVFGLLPAGNDLFNKVA
jgi:hypothetical protein